MSSLNNSSLLDTLWSEKTAIYHSFKPDDSKLKLLKNGITSELLMSVKLLSLSKEEFFSEMLFYGVPEASLGIRSELAIAETLVNICRKAIKAYDTQIEEDEMLLEKENLTARQRMAIQLRKGEKQILKRIGSYYYQKAIELSMQLERETKRTNYEQLLSDEL